MTSIAKALQKVVDPHGIFVNLTNVKIIKEGRILYPWAKNIYTKKSMFLRKGVYLSYEYKMPIGYDGPTIDDIEYVAGCNIVYMTSKEFFMLSLRA